jgi:hypothetical protein
VWWEDGHLLMIDQNKLPFEFAIAKYGNYMEVATAIREMTVRGAPAIGAAGAYGMALAAQSAPDARFRAYMRAARDELISTRPTAIDLLNGVSFVYESTIKFIPDVKHARQVAIFSAENWPTPVPAIVMRSARWARTWSPGGPASSLIATRSSGHGGLGHRAGRGEGRPSQENWISLCMWTRPVPACRERGSRPGNWSRKASLMPL